MGKSDSSVAPMVCGGNVLAVIRRVRYFQFQKECAAMAAFMVPIFSSVCSSACWLHTAISVVSTTQGCGSEVPGCDQHKPFA